MKCTCQKFVTFLAKVFNHFQCPPEADSLLLLQFCAYHYADNRPGVTNEVRVEGQLYKKAITTKSNDKEVYEKCQHLSDLTHGPVGTVKTEGKKGTNLFA